MWSWKTPTVVRMTTEEGLSTLAGVYVSAERFCNYVIIW